MGYTFKRKDLDNGMEGYWTENDDYGLDYEAKVFDSMEELETIAQDPPADESGNYEYTIEEWK